MNFPTFNREKTVCVTGHRTVEDDLDVEGLKNLFNRMAENGINNFLVGMAVGFDSLCFKLLEKVRKKYPIKIVACIPCPNQSKNFSDKQKKEYEKMLKSADETVLLSETYNSYCMQKRNMYMVDNSNYVVAYLRKNFGGTYNTVVYANKQGVRVIEV